ncbi:MAG: anaerobic sulfatase maturase [Planctomycetota bacterium]
MGSVLIKPVGDRCNLGCRYCFFHPNRDTAPGETMPLPVLETLIKNYLSYRDASDVRIFGWQGGEPTLAGIDFFETAMALQKKYNRANRVIRNAFQTNGVLIDDDWARFFKRNDILVGLSIDGPAGYHNANRLTMNGLGAFDLARKAWSVLSSQGVAVNALVVVSKANEQKASDVFRFLIDDIKAEYAQFIPCVEWESDGRTPTEFSVSPGGYGRFLIDLFDAWRSESSRAFSVKIFDDLILHLAGKPMGDCMHAPDCGSHFAILPNGDVFPCDFFINPDWRLGNVLKTDFNTLERTPKARNFVRRKKRERSADCRSCPFLHVCGGGCPKLRPPGAPSLYYLCDDMKLFFSERLDALKEMAAAVKIRMKQLQTPAR